MGTQLKRVSPQTALERVLEALGQELLDASDEEILTAAQDLGMDPTMRESAAFRGLTFPTTPQLSDFFEVDPRLSLPRGRKPPTGK